MFPGEPREMIFDNRDILGEIASKLTGKELIEFMRVNKNINSLKEEKYIQTKIDNYFNCKANIIQDRFRKYINKLNFLDGINETGIVSLNRLNRFLYDEFRLVDKFYLSYSGKIGTKLLSVDENLSVNFDELITFKRLIKMYLR